MIEPKRESVGAVCNGVACDDVPIRGIPRFCFGSWYWLYEE
jgi:hypothetical protein